jgi:methylmalonyl-CoA/ethylmalonyl-CoA epimerase
MPTRLPADTARDLHHIGIVVGDLDAAVADYAALGFDAGAPFAVPEQKIVAVTFRTGAGWIELIQPTDPEGPIARFHAKRGDGVHHVGYRVSHLQTTLDELAQRGVRLIDTAPRRGAHGWQIAFVHPESCSGVLTELVQTDESD